ncbi:MAG: class I SAM-dependent methyltransferase [Ferruginibacter sp.]
MYSQFSIFKKYIKYYFTASNGKGHGIHSPFVFDFVNNVLNKPENNEAILKIEKLRNDLLSSNEIIVVEDFGAGSRKIKDTKRLVKNIAKTSLKSKKYANLLFRISKYYKVDNIVELGTSLGITTAYLAASESNVFTIEGSNEVAKVASSVFNNIDRKNINLFVGKFEDQLPLVLAKINNIGLGYVDGDHRKIPTLNYFNLLKSKSTENSIIIFDDIYWSKEMEEAWETIKADSDVTLTIDLFFIGIVFFIKDFKVKQDFTIRF